MIDKLKKLWFLLTTIIVLLQTALTFYFLYQEAKGYSIIKLAVSVLAVCYLAAFIVIAFMSRSKSKYSHEAMSSFKNSRKRVKRFLNLIILALNIIYLIRLDGVIKIYPVAMLFINIMLILFDIKMAEIADKKERKRKKKAKEKAKQKENKQKIEKAKEEKETNYNKHKKKHFFGDFSNK